MTFAAIYKTFAYLLIGSGFAAITTTDIIDLPSVIGFTVVFLASWRMNTGRLRQSVPTWLFNAIAAGYLCFLPLDYWLISHSVILAGVHVLFFTSAVKLLTRSNDRDYLYLFFISLAELLLAATLTVHIAFIFCFMMFVFSGLTILVLMEMLRSHARMQRQANVLPFVAARTPQEIGMELFAPFPTRMFVAVVLGTAILIFAGAVPLFYSLPRISLREFRRPLGKPQFISGFADHIELGRVGEIRESDAVVMRVQTETSSEKLDPDWKWKGLAFDDFDGRTWRRSRIERKAVPTQGRFYKLENSTLGADLLRQTFFVEALSADVIFAASRILAVSKDVGILEKDAAGNIYTSLHTKTKLRYLAISDPVRPDAALITNQSSAPPEIAKIYLQLPSMDPRIKELAQSATQNSTGRYGKARALETYLRTHYAYSLTLRGNPHHKDPLAMFLFDVRSGHCEYFASAMTVMLRQIGIPARMINGFRAGDYNRIGNSWTVRRYHAHSWTEAYFPPYGWIEFDPTPVQSVQHRNTLKQFFFNLTDAIGLWWWDDFVNYDASKQYQVVTKVLSELESVHSSVDAVIFYFKQLGQNARSALHSPVKIPKLNKNRLFLLLLTVLLLILAVRPVRRRLILKIRQCNYRNNNRATAIHFYTEALELLASHGLRRTKDQTAMEFAQSLGAQPAASVFLSLTQIYYAARFGEADIQAIPFHEARALVYALRKALRNNRPIRT